MTINELLSYDKSELANISETIKPEDIETLIQLLTEKDDNIRYQAFLLLQNRSGEFNDVYPYWETFAKKLKSDNSYQRSIGLMLLAENTKWDTEKRFDGMVDDFLQILHDDKPITVRQCIQALGRVVPYKEDLHRKIAGTLMSYDIMSIKETMRKLVLLDILTILSLIRKYRSDDEITEYIFRALSGELLDKKSKKLIEAGL